MDKIVESLTIVLFLGFILGVIFWDYTRRGREFEQKIHDILLSKVPPASASPGNGTPTGTTAPIRWPLPTPMARGITPPAR
jgi:hypothetical protein